MNKQLLMNTGNPLILLAALTGCATPPQKTQVQPTVQSSPCHSQLVSQRLFMMITGRGLQTCIERPGYDTCMAAVTTVERMQANFGIDHALFRSCFPEYMRTEQDAFKEAAVELSVFQKQLVKAEAIMKKASKVGHF